MNEITKQDKIANKVCFIAILVASFCWGYTSRHFK